MKITRIIALAIIAGATGTAGIQAQTLRETSPPAEFPPASYAGKQYVDSRGCVYIRAGIDGNVTWVPRVTRSRQQICGYAPTQVAGTTRQPQTASAPELITLEPSQQPSGTASASPVPEQAAPIAAATVKPRRTAQPASARPAAIAAAPAAASPAPVIIAVQPGGGTGCDDLSAISRQHIYSASARCGPQAEAPVTYGTGENIRRSNAPLSLNTRVVQTHIYQDRRLSNSFAVPEGYRPVWTDGRLNPRRAERTIRPAVVTGFVQAPAGYQQVERDDGRMNPLRGVRTPGGDAQTALVWTSTVPRKLVSLPLDRETFELPRDVRESPAEARPKGLRLSTRSAPGAAAPEPVAVSRRYVRAATYADPEQAKAAARKLAAAGLAVRLGSVSRQGQPYKVVLAGPYRNRAQAADALARVQRAGFSRARLSK